MALVRKALDGEFDRYIDRHKANLPNETIGVGTGYDFQLFDRALLYSGDSRFVLAGIVNRMDRVHLAQSPESCGEVRLIYRLTGQRKPAMTRASAAPADDAEHRAEGARRDQNGDSDATRSPAPRSPVAGWLRATCR